MTIVLIGLWWIVRYGVLPCAAIMFGCWALGQIWEGLGELREDLTRDLNQKLDRIIVLLEQK